MTRPVFSQRRMTVPLAAAMVLACPHAAASQSCDTPEQAIVQFRGLTQAAVALFRQERAPLAVQKDKIGLVLVARPAPESTVDTDALRRDIETLSQNLAQPPAQICGAIEQIRRAHGL